jgi:hypothetical protein
MMTAISLTPIPGSPTFGVPTRFPGPTRSGRAALVPLDDADARTLAPGDVLVRYQGHTTDGASPVIVVASRMGIHENDGDEPVAVPVVDFITRDGRSLAANPADLLAVVVRTRGGRS